jgi:hypothetical protein
MARDVDAALAAERVRLEAQIGEAIAVYLPGLAASGSFDAVAWGFGMRAANKHGGGAAAITFGKNRYGLLALTAAGRLKLYRTKATRKGSEIEATVGDWGPGDVQVTMHHAGGLLRIGILTAQQDAMGFELADWGKAAKQMTDGFAAALGLTIG